jgi:hypothetical protein
MTNALRSPAVPVTLRRSVARATRVVLAAALVLGVGIASAVVTSSSSDRATAAGPLGAGGEYQRLPTPERILDTRLNGGAPKPLVTGAGAVFDAPVLGLGGLPGPASAGDVLAVVANVTVTGATQQGYLRVFGTGAAEGESSLVNFKADQNVPNMVVLRPGTDGKVTIRLISEGQNGSAHVIIDVFGWFSTSNYPTRGARLQPVDPGRISDTRNAGQLPMSAGQVRTITFRGASTVSPPLRTGVVPADPNIVGALVNVTGVNNLPGSTTTFLSLVPENPAPGVWPATSNVNLRAGQIKANLALVPLGADGNFRIFNEAGSVHVVVDVVGWLVNGASDTSCAGRVVPLSSPFRALDTRSPAAGNAPLSPGRAEDWSFKDFVADVQINGVPVGAQLGELGNLTATDLQRQYSWAPVDSFMTAYPTVEGPPPVVSNLNVVENESVPNMSLLKFGDVAGDPQVRFYNFNGFVHYLFDVSAVVLAEPCAA